MTVTARPDLSAMHTAGQQSLWFDPQANINQMRKPERYIYMFSVAKKAFIIERPPLFPQFHARACPKGERYTAIGRIPDPINQAMQDPNTGRMVSEAHDGLRVAIDLINPNNMSTDFNWVCPPQYQGEITTGYGCDLSKQGLFISLSETPKEEEIKAAVQRVHDYYEGLRKDIELTPDKNVAEKVFMNDDYGAMADYFGLDYPWHKKMTAKTSCPNCQTTVPVGIAFHAIGNTVCVIDWARTVKAGVKTKADAKAAGVEL